MDALRRASEHIRWLENRVRELESILKEKDSQLLRLSTEVPGGQRKLTRLGLALPNRQALQSPVTGAGPGAVRLA